MGRPLVEAAGAGEAAIRWYAATTVLVCQLKGSRGLDGHGRTGHDVAQRRAQLSVALWDALPRAVAPAFRA